LRERQETGMRRVRLGWGSCNSLTTLPFAFNAKTRS